MQVVEAQEVPRRANEPPIRRAPTRAGWAGVVERRLLAAVIRRGDDGNLLSPALLQRLLGFLYLSGATIGIASMAFPQPPGTDVEGLFAVYGVAYLVGAILLAARGRLPTWAPALGLALGTALITLAIHFTSEREGVYSMFYLWISITAFYFFKWWQAGLQVALVGAAYATVLVDQQPAGAEEEWIITLGTVLVAGLFVGVLRRGVERLIDDLAEAARTDHARLYAAEREARLEADRATESLRRLQQLTDVALTHLKLDALLDELLTRVGEVLTVDFTTILLREESGDKLVVQAARGIDGVERGSRIRLGEGFAGRVAAEVRPLVAGAAGSVETMSPRLRELGLQSLLGVPLISEGRVIGVLVVGSLTERQFTPDETRLLQLVADRAALGIDHARLYEREHRIAETLQRSLLPDSLPRVPGIAVAARYLPARAEARVGGDWYDAVPLADGGLAITIGDVAGHGIQAAALMGRLRDVLRAAALEGAPVTSATQRAERLVESQRDGQDSFATALFLVMGPRGSEIEFSRAGHLPPLVVGPDGEARYLEGGLSPPLGAGSNGARDAGSARIEPGSVMLLYTDGLVERRDAGIGEGLERLRRAARAASRDPERFCDEVVERMLGGEGPADDVALLAIAVGRG